MKRRRRFFGTLLFLIIVSCFLIFRSCGDEKEATPINKNITNEDNSPKDNFTVCIDAGHGEYDSGATSKTFDVAEKDIVLSVALSTGKLLSDKGIKVIYTREKDEIPWKEQTESLEGRSKFSNENNADLFVSIHCNYYKNSTDVKGTEVYCFEKETKDEKLAQIISDNLAKLKFTENRGIKYNSDKNLYVVENTKATSVLVELGYLSNTDDTVFLKDSKGQAKCADAISSAIIEYKDLITKEKKESK
ncbi:N-acetylmuramoyl-L-alanine amidase [Clostridiaceae bacterium M8S5]|nr:N-acetylmuramoyl-L-alanine amidase [Clostridiaceae bacterium M8S5]